MPSYKYLGIERLSTPARCGADFQNIIIHDFGLNIPLFLRGCASGQLSDLAHPISTADSTGSKFLDQRLRERNAFKRPPSESLPVFNIGDVLWVEMSNYTVQVEQHYVNHATTFSQNPIRRNTNHGWRRVQPSNAGPA